MEQIPLIKACAADCGCHTVKSNTQTCNLSEPAEYAALIPGEKSLQPDWVDALFTRGERTIYTKKRDELRYIGMPIGGICCGTLYLGGDGKLWAWDILNQTQEGILPRSIDWDGFDGPTLVKPRDGACYIQPHVNARAIAQGFALKIDGRVKSLDERDWDEVTFCGEYPIGTITYTDPTCPIQTTLNAYSPFIPLNADDSGLPVVLMEFQLTNTTECAVALEIAGWMENIAGRGLPSSASYQPVNRVVTLEGTTVVSSHINASQLESEVNQSGTVALVLLASGVGKADVTPQSVFDAPAAPTATKASGQALIGGIVHSLRLEARQSTTVTFAVAWHFPTTTLPVRDAASGNYYASRFTDATAVIEYVVQNIAHLRETTIAWRDTWYDSTLPFWFLDRTFLNTSILATTTAHRFATGRFWAWEGVGCCEGTCTHVWHYAQAVARLFPELERDMRERVDFGSALDPETGQIGFRGEHTGPAIDGQAGRILSVYREHQMCSDAAFLKRVWPNVKKAMTYLMDHDRDGDGLLDGAQENTLDAAWFGKIAWISGLYAAALRACELMALEIGDVKYADLCRTHFLKSKNAIETQLFDGEYFTQLPEPGHEDALGTYAACHIDQVLGQSWAWQIGLGRVLDLSKTVSALEALYQYNFTLDIGPYRRAHHGGRPYALDGEGGLIMTTNPKNLPNPYGNVADWQYGYFSECMTGFEHQVASHMIFEGMVTEGLAITRAIHDRYHASKRNPYNEIECSDHYARAMASYGSFIAICGFSYHGPLGQLGFAPRITPDNFRAPFTVSEGWGTFAQTYSGKEFEAKITLRYGQLRLTSLTLALPENAKIDQVALALDGQPLITSHSVQEGNVTVSIAPAAVIGSDQTLIAKIRLKEASQS